MAQIEISTVSSKLREQLTEFQQDIYIAEYNRVVAEQRAKGELSHADSPEAAAHDAAMLRVKQSTELN